MDAIRIYGRTAEIQGVPFISGGEHWVRVRYFEYDSEDKSVYWGERHNVPVADIEAEFTTDKVEIQRY